MYRYIKLYQISLFILIESKVSHDMEVSYTTLNPQYIWKSLRLIYGFDS